jgi:putative ABC transport system permease protein
VGLLKALGARESQVLGLFLTEALLLAGAGTLAGIGLAYGGLWLANSQLEAFQLVAPAWAPLAAAGVSLGDDLGDLALIPVAAAQALFDNPSLFRILVQATGRDALEAAAEDIRTIIRSRHEGEDDITVITQDAMLSTFDRILGALTLAVAGIAAISLTVAGVLIMNVMLVAVSQRTAEVGLLKALGARESQVLGLFLTEALLLAGAGTLAGVVLAYGGLWVANTQLEAFKLVAPAWAPLAASGVSLGAGLLFGILPARRAARLDPVAALAGR